MQELENPDINWYEKTSSSKSLPQRCPYATIKLCPKYFFSYSLCAKVGSTSKLSNKDDYEVMKFWESTNYLPMIAESEPTISGNDIKNYRNYCPEVLYTLFGYFASSVHHFNDEIDQQIAEIRLTKIKADRNNWRWYYSSIIPLHYSDCEYFSLIKRNDKNVRTDEILELKPNFYGIGINLNALFKMIFKRNNK